MKKLDEAEKKTLIIWTIFGIIFAILAFLVKINVKIDIPIKAPVMENKYSPLKDYSRYYVVKGALAKFYAFSNADNRLSMLHIMDKKYIETNEITLENIKEKLGIKGNLDINTNIIFERKIKKGIYSYLVYAKEIVSTSSKEVRDVYYELILDGNTFLFSLKPIDDSVYWGVRNE